MKQLEIDNLVQKILDNRKKQKLAIEQNIEGQELFTEQIQKSTQPIVNILQDNALANRELITKALTKPKVPAIEQETEPDDEYEDANDYEDDYGDDKFVQRLYSKYRNQKTNKTSSFEADMSGKIGLLGTIDLPRLFNKNELFYYYKTEEGEKATRVGKENVTEGLAALLLLPSKDIRDANIKPTHQDVKLYSFIMQQVGFRPSNATKYKLIVNKLDAEKKKLALAETQGKGNFKGHGIHTVETHCPSPHELMSRLELLFGSLKAGNNSKQIRHEARSILDAMLDRGLVNAVVHRQIYQGYNLF